MDGAELAEGVPVADLDEATLAAMGSVIARTSAAMKKALGCPAVSILVRDGEAAGQEIPHVHVHLVPRYEGDKAHHFKGGSYGDTDEARAAAMSAMAEKLQAAF